MVRALSAVLAGVAAAGACAVAHPPAGAVAAASGCGDHRAGRAILISLAEQRLTACQDGGVVVDTPVTTGRPQLPTPRGSTVVASRNSPWIMRSRWPRGSPYWYAPSRVQYAMWFRPDYAIHDAPWRAHYGPGTQANGSHGCVNVPRPAMDRLYAWTAIGTPVIVR